MSVTLRMTGVAAAIVLIATPAAASAKEFTVSLDAMSFGHLPSEAKVGDTIVWVNRDTVQHSATAKDGSFDVRLQPGQKGSSVLKQAGSLAIYCIYHPMMRGTLKVVS